MDFKNTKKDFFLEKRIVIFSVGFILGYLFETFFG